MCGVGTTFLFLWENEHMDAPKKREYASWKSAFAWLMTELGILPAMVVDPQGISDHSDRVRGAGHGLPDRDRDPGHGGGNAGRAEWHGDGQHRYRRVASLDPVGRAHETDRAGAARAAIAGDIPSAAPALRLPDARIDQQGSLSAATAMATQAGNYEQVLIANGLQAVRFHRAVAERDGGAGPGLHRSSPSHGGLGRGQRQRSSSNSRPGRRALALINAMLVRQFGSGSADPGGLEHAPNARDCGGEQQRDPGGKRDDQRNHDDDEYRGSHRLSRRRLRNRWSSRARRRERNRRRELCQDVKLPSDRDCGFTDAWRTGSLQGEPVLRLIVILSHVAVSLSDRRCGATRSASPL